ncbi:SEC-C metal-binding domain-containing protein, partial [uncultured Nevskia sp.]|uniref:preprotein translocase subunit SecA n=1 Tax=uncultured Nevskia sp. TaxID=228950 RepID=UPI0025FAC5B2
NYFRLYSKLSGMTGTADTEAFEFQNIYNLEVIVIPTNRAMVRDDRGDLIYISAKGKFDAVIKDIEEVHAKRQPILVGTASIETSELLANLLTQKGIVHEVLNAKQHEREAEIVAQAGRPGAVTIATNMAGRGTDIVLGGSLEAELHAIAEDDVAAREAAKAAWKERHAAVVASGGLYVIGSERHESRRIDNQLRGRSGRQGDPGATRFYLSLDDTLMRIFAPPSMRGLLQRLGMQEGEALEAKMVTRSIETAQRKVEAHNFDIRKNLLEYDNVANDQRKAIYELRDELMGAAVVTPMIDDIRADVVTAVVAVHVPPQSPEEMWNLEALEEALRKDFGTMLPIRQWAEEDPQLDDRKIKERIGEILSTTYADKKAKIGGTVLESFERETLLRVLDTFWREHLAAMDYLRLGIHLRGYAQKDPKQEYKREAFTMFNDMLARFKHEVVSRLARIQILTEDEVHALEEARRAAAPPMEFQHADAQSVIDQPDVVAVEPTGEGRSLSAPTTVDRPEAFVRDMPKVGRNDPCPCGSGKKFKQCHGALV